MKTEQIDITAQVLRDYKTKVAEHLDNGWLVPRPTRQEAKALAGIKVYATKRTNPLRRHK